MLNKSNIHGNPFFALGILLLFVFQSCGITHIADRQPDLTGYTIAKPIVKKHHDSLFTSGDNYLIKNKHQQWELYIKGDALKRGLLAGALLDTLLEKQEKALYNKVEEFLPKEKHQNLVRRFLKWYNRELEHYVPLEYKVEIYGQSRYSSPKFNKYAPPYIRNLYLHAAHDIGHALVDLSLIGCTSAALWDDQTTDGKLLIGRNLDFYVNDEFAEEKLLIFMKPDEGIPFVSIGWPGMLGVVSGMNKKGLTVTMNAGKSKIPLKAKEPISIVARNILQYASNIEEAIEIASKSEVFVSEALMIGSAKDNKAVLIEMSPKNFGVYEVANNRLVCSNHFQSDAYNNDKRNQKAIINGTTVPRFERMNELLDQTEKINPNLMAEHLRNKEGVNDIALGYGNELALNQLISHHGVIFKPSEKTIWISSSPYQLGAFIAYNLDEIFDEERTDYTSRAIENLTIPADPFLQTKAYKDYEEYKKLDKLVNQAIQQKRKNFDFSILDQYRTLNPDLWIVHFKSGKLFYQTRQFHKAEEAFAMALEKEISSLPEKKEVENMYKKTKMKAK